jgi:hypothetical protein
MIVSGHGRETPGAILRRTVHSVERFMVSRIMLSGLDMLALSQTGEAQERRPQVGVGVSLDLTPTGDFSLFDELHLTGRTGNIHVPIQISPTVRLEPMIGYAHESQEATNGSATSKAAGTLWRAGVGLLFQFSNHEDFQAYAGGRAGLARRSVKLTNSDPNFPPPTTAKASQKNTFVAAVLGGEFYFSPRFSLGAEAQLVFTDLGDVKNSTSPPPPVPTPGIGESGSELTTAGLIVVRWYP